ncbi:putative ATP-dependent DNA helicase [Phytophthora infestans]|uniref:Putative ATP-dependent DNA helicase n=1 Tax=Phytophthora infestans TaxID=4787 RepID=A0A833SU18_PHYIN|nr:putative ATP-dependent DNA helicase [Phytophthora infestans]
MKTSNRILQENSALDCDDKKIFSIIASPRSLSPASDLASNEAAFCSRALLAYQHHHWFHLNSCFKVTKRTPDGKVCRMSMPNETCKMTRWTSDNRIELKRHPGNEYINTYVPIVNALFKCNHDIKFLAAGEGPEKANYTIKYTTKHQQDLENPWEL